MIIIAAFYEFNPSNVQPITFSLISHLKYIFFHFQKPRRLQPDRDEPDDVAGHDGEPGLLGPDRRDPAKDGGDRLVAFRKQTSQHA